MGIMGKLKGELVDIIEWLDDGRTTFAWRFPRYQNEIKNGAQLIVREGQKAAFVYRGQLADVFEPGAYQLTSENLPILGTLQGWKHGFNSPFRSEVYFVNTRPVTDLRWGTPQPVTVRDPDFKMVQVRANGLCVAKIDDVETFLKEIIGSGSTVESEELSELLRKVITLAFSDMVMETGLGAIDLQGRQVELSDKLREFVNARVDHDYGLTITQITMNISLPDEITQAMTRGVARGVEESGFLDNVGDLGRYQQAKAADAMVAAADNPGGSAMGDAMQMGMGIAMAGQMANTVGQAMQPQGQQPAPPQGGHPPAGGAAPPPLPGQGGAPAVVFHVEMNGAPQGPFTLDQVQSGIGSGQVQATTLVWSEGMSAWTQAGEVDGLKPFFVAPPPMPGGDAPGGGATPPPMPGAGGPDGPAS
jgi:membrane protease subunit (stomatin/prohibitin family)